MTKWEYKAVEFKVLDVANGLTEIGKEGWELVYVSELPGMYRAILKRPMSSDHPMLGV